MTNLINYLLEANMALIIFLAVYHLLLVKETNYRIMRFFLLAVIACSLVVPLINFHTMEDGTLVNQFLQAISLPEITISDNNTPAESEVSLVLQITSTVYLAGLVLFLIKFVVELFSLVHLITKSKTYKHGRFRIAESDHDHPTFSFFS